MKHEREKEHESEKGMKEKNRWKNLRASLKMDTKGE